MTKDWMAELIFDEINLEVEETLRKKRPPREGSHSCHTCVHYESFMDGDSYYEPYSGEWVRYCIEKPWVSNLKQFPFQETMCKHWTDQKPREEIYPLTRN